ncbi:MAG: single-stranded DNA-binding protein [Oscillospiraceae bacterium]|nr:single-stranded DNA-binding protein [Oscillospiraceae bacterium]
MLNHITIMGRLTRDPELRRTGSGIAVASFTVAVERDFAQDGKKETDFIDCVAWRQTGEFVSKYFAKGRMIVVSGRLQIRSWTDKDGNKRKTAEVVADNCYFGDSKSSSDNAGLTGTGDPYSGGAYTDTMAEIERQRNNNSYAGYGGYSAPQYQQGEFAMIEDDDAQLPF